MLKRNVPEIMRAVRSINTSPELLFRKKLWSKGYRYRIHSERLPGKPDVVLAAYRVAIFIDGDFWHGGQWRKRKLLALEEQFSKSNSKKYWLKKIRANMRRDCQSSTMLDTEWMDSSSFLGKPDQYGFMLVKFIKEWNLNAKNFYRRTQR